MNQKITKEMIDQLKKLHSHDYQKRKGQYPKSNIPDSIDVTHNIEYIFIECLFKNTDEDTSKKWLKRKLEEIGVDGDSLKIYSCQDGDYQDDRVSTYTTINLLYDNI